jgi:predicted  nucleic acid-binding Zn-ribbon protein
MYDNKGNFGSLISKALLSFGIAGVLQTTLLPVNAASESITSSPSAIAPKNDLSKQNVELLQKVNAARSSKSTKLSTSSSPKLQEEAVVSAAKLLISQDNEKIASLKDQLKNIKNDMYKLKSDLSKESKELQKIEAKLSKSGIDVDVKKNALDSKKEKTKLISKVSLIAKIHIKYL